MKVERIKAPGIIVLDIDDTLIRADTSIIHIYKVFPDGHEEALTTAEYANDPDALDKGVSAGVKYDYRDFNDPAKLLKSIENGTPLVKNLKIMDRYINRGWDVAFLTARGQEDLIYDILKDKIMYRDTNGKLHILGDKLNREFSAAINDEFKVYKGRTDSEKKANVLRRLSANYDKVLFIDDDEKNVQAASKLNLPNLKVVKSWKESYERNICNK